MCEECGRVEELYLFAFDVFINMWLCSDCCDTYIKNEVENIRLDSDI